MWKVFFIIPQNMVKIYLLEQNISAKSFYSELLAGDNNKTATPGSAEA